VAKAVLLLHRKRIHDDGAVSEVELWRVPAPVPGSAHPFKYSLFHGYPGRRAVGYDNERGKGTTGTGTAKRRPVRSCRWTS
jgi:hypothetical protein